MKKGQQENGIYEEMVLVQPRDFLSGKRWEQQIQVTETANRPLVPQFLLYFAPSTKSYLSGLLRHFGTTTKQSQVSPFCLSWQMEFFHFTEEYHTNIITQRTNLIPFIK